MASSSSSSEPIPAPKIRSLHGYDYSPKEQAEKEAILKQLESTYPNVNPLWAEYVYDFCYHTPQDQLDRIMETNAWDYRSKFNGKLESKK
tara:strand:- start:1156 stop:1425 length:270 start_codon:yes stop_codon:yes gene_type:complete